MEIDEYQNYQKAQGALNEALKCLGKTKTKNPAALEAKIKFLNERLKLVKRFADARRLVTDQFKYHALHCVYLPYSMYAIDPEGCVCECRALLNEPNLDTAVRTGDVYGLLIEHFAQARDYKQVYM